MARCGSSSHATGRARSSRRSCGSISGFDGFDDKIIAMYARGGQDFAAKLGRELFPVGVDLFALPRCRFEVMSNFAPPWQRARAPEWRRRAKSQVLRPKSVRDRLRDMWRIKRGRTPPTDLRITTLPIWLTIQASTTRRRGFHTDHHARRRSRAQSLFRCPSRRTGT
jgi:hypothetical protein